MFETLVKARGLFSTGQESHSRIEQVSNLHPAKRNWASNRLIAEDATPDAAETLSRHFYAALRDRDGNPTVGESVTMLEKTPKNALRVPFFAAAWPESRFIYLYRDVRQTLASMIEAWMSGRFRTYAKLPGWTGHPWSLLLVPGWHQLKGLPLREIVAHQWATTTEFLLDDLEGLSPNRVRVVSYADFLAAPQRSIEELAAALGLEWDSQLGAQLALSKYTVSLPDPDKWRRVQEDVEAVMPIVERADARAKLMIGRLA